VVRAGKVVGLIECDILDERQRLVARASSTCMTLQGRLAEGRQVGLAKTFVSPGQRKVGQDVVNAG
jgi:hypothetical protein